MMLAAMACLSIAAKFDDARFPMQLLADHVGISSLSGIPHLKLKRAKL